ncbi:MAG TPA: hypothetical protein VFL12_03545, partial [Thermoanaerobaculia bacterium]|nr:hypothetical protein [Thermoanaerobaculia bacterium]
KNFFGLIGWTAHGDLRWFQISGPFLAVDLGAAVAVGLLAAAWTWRRDFRDPAAPRRAAVASWLVAAAVFVATFGWLVSRPAVSPLKLAAESFLFALPFLALFRIATKGTGGIVDSARLVSLGFALAYFWNVARSYLLTGEMRGAHGRYYFAVIGFLALGFWLPAADLLRARAGRNRIFAAAVIVLFANEAAFYAFRVVPFYRGAAAAVLRP